MKRTKIVLSFFLAFFMVLSNIGPAFASEAEGMAEEIGSVLEEAEPTAEDIQEESPEPSPQYEVIKSENLDLAPELEPDPEPSEEEPAAEELGEDEDGKSPAEDLESDPGNDLDKPVEEKVNLRVTVDLRGLGGEDFAFDQIFPQGADLDFIYWDLESQTEKRITRRFTSLDNDVDFSDFLMRKPQVRIARIIKRTSQHRGLTPGDQKM